MTKYRVVFETFPEEHYTVEYKSFLWWVSATFRSFKSIEEADAWVKAITGHRRVVKTYG